VSVTRAIGPSDVAIVVPVGGAAPALERSTESLRRLDPAPGEIVVVVDGADEALAARASVPGATVIVLEVRGGPARARNRGAEAADSEILLFIDADIEVPVDLVARVAALFADAPELTAAFGSYDDAPGDDGFVSQYRNLLHHFVHQHASERASTFWAGCGAIRREAFLAAGGFDERYAHPSIEDIQLGARLVRGGHSIRLVKTLAVKHLKRWRLADMLSTDLWRRAVPWTELMLRDGRLVNDLNTKVRDRVSVVLAFVPLLALPAAWAWPSILVLVPAAAAAIVAVNAALFGFFLRRRGPGFAAATLPLFWLYLLVCGAGFAIGLVRHHLGARA
jgi:glycosyltransferase involved in cell wall biosynthesis